MQDKELTGDSSSDTKVRAKHISRQISRDYHGALGVVVTGPDASDVYVIGGGQSNE